MIGTDRLTTRFGAICRSALLTGLALATALSWMATAAQAADTLDKVRARSELACGVIGRSKGFSFPDSKGVMQGIDADYCRAVAAAVLGDASKVKFVTLTATTRFTALQSGEVDLVNAQATWTAARDSQLGLSFASIYFFDGGNFLVRKGSGVTNRKELNGASFCINPGGAAEQVLLDYARLNKIEIVPVNIDSQDQLSAAFVSGRCDVLMSDASALHAFRTAQGRSQDKYLLLPGGDLYKSPLGSVVRADDIRWFNLVRWTHYALVSAEELGVTSENVDAISSSTTEPDIRRLLGLDGSIGQGFGLKSGWVADIVRQVGNYGEIYERNFAPLGIPRGQNALAANGGLQYAPPYR